MNDRTPPIFHRAACCKIAAGVATAWALAIAGCTPTSDLGPPNDGGEDSTSHGAAADATVGDSAADVSGPGVGTDAGHAGAIFSAQAIAFGSVGCGTTQTTSTLSITSTGSHPLVVTATTTGSNFSVTPSSLSVADGGVGILTISANVPGGATAGLVVNGSLNLFTNDPSNVNVAVPLSLTPTGGTLAAPSGASPVVAFPTTPVGTPTQSLGFSLVNIGNAPVGVSFADPSSQAFSLRAEGMTTVAPQGSVSASATFLPSSTAIVGATVPVVTTGVICGQSVSSVSMTGQGATGHVTGYPTAPIDFGSSVCGSTAAPSDQSFTLTNTGNVDARFTQVSLSGAPGFTTNASPGRYVPANSQFIVRVSAPPVTTSLGLKPITAALTIQTDADPSPHVVSLTEEPMGAVLSFDTSLTTGFGSFGAVSLLGATSQPFAVQNTGNGAATVTFTTLPAANDAGVPSPFSAAVPSVSVPAGGTAGGAVVFAPTWANSAVGSISMSSSSALCAPLPAALPLSGVGLGGGPSVTPQTLSFPATCGGAPPAAQTFVVTNLGTADMTWAMGPLTGPGAALYGVTPGTPPGLLLPGESSIVTVTASAVGSPAPSVDPSHYSASISITTDVPFDPVHVVKMTESPLGDQLAFGPTDLRFGQATVGTSLSRPVTVVNNSPPGSPSASFALVLDGGSAYRITPSGGSNLAPGGTSDAITLSFNPTTATAFPATLALSTNDPVCSPLPPPLVVSGTGTEGKVAVSTTTLSFGSDPKDPRGLVNCGSVGQPKSFTVTNAGNQAFTLVGLSLGKGASSPFTVTGASLPATIPIAGGVTLTVTPKSMPASVADPNDATAFADTLTILTDAAQDTPHAVSLFMQPRGAVIGNTPLASSWTFGSTGVGSIGTITTPIRNTGNAAASAQLTGLAQPSVFGILSNPTTVAPNAVTPMIAQFTPPTADGLWSDQGAVSLTSDAFCAPLPPQWIGSNVVLSGASNAASPLSISGALVFPTTSCGATSPAALPVTISNGTNVAYPYTLTFGSGTFYSIANSGPGSIPPGGTVTVLVAPKTVTPGPGVVPGSLPYSDQLTVTVATTPPTKFTVPISWALDGAVFSLPEGNGPLTDASGIPFYLADSSGTTTLPVDNKGTAAATIGVTAAPTGGFQVLPSQSFAVVPGIRAAPQLTGAAGNATCPGTTNSTASFVYAGPVCQPLPFTSVRVHACVGTL